jgi:hypothetical protein
VRLARDATSGLTDLVEALHAQIAHPLAPRGARLSGISGLVYRSIRGVSALAGGGAQALLAALPALAPRLARATASGEREAVVAALNGVLGDYLAASGNPLAIPMALRSRGRALRLQPASLAASLPHAGPRLLVLVHGLCMNDLQWRHAGHDHGAALARELGVTPVYLHYNSGLPISLNGQLFSEQMELLLRHWPVPLQELGILAHSMGGLVARSAWRQGADADRAWVQRLDRLVFLGTPHHGAPLERGGHGIEQLLELSRYSAPFARLARLRSAGITDLRHGNLLASDWAGRGRFESGRDTRSIVPLPASVACYTIAGHNGALGDGLVRVRSALGEHDDPRRTLAFAARRRWVAEGVGHLQLLGDAGVYDQLRRWFARQPGPRAAANRPFGRR